jgi:FdhE protein
MCGEDRFELLAVFASDRIPQVRIDACESCRYYIKTVDMTKDGLAVPVVDELAAISLDVWAADEQYRKRVPNLLGL